MAAARAAGLGTEIVFELDEAGRSGGGATPPGRGRRRSARRSSLPRSSPRGFELNSTPRGFSVARSSRSTRGSSCDGTWNSDGVGEDAVEALGGRSRARKSCCQTSHPVAARAIATKRGGALEPDRPVPERANVARSRPGPQPKSRIVKGGAPSMCRSSVSMFWRRRDRACPQERPRRAGCSARAWALIVSRSSRSVPSNAL